MGKAARNRRRRNQASQLPVATAPGGHRRRQQVMADSRAIFDAKSADPRYQEHIAAQAADPGVQAAIAEYRPGQEARLAAQRWQRRWDGNDGIGCWDHRAGIRVVHSVGREQDGEIWGHVSVSRRDLTFPSWLQTERAHWLLYPDLPGIIVVAPEAQHVNLQEVSHVWVKLTGDPPCPDFTHGYGSI